MVRKNYLTCPAIAIEAEFQFATSNQRLDPMNHQAASLPWNHASWPSQLASLGKVEQLVLVTNMPVVWPPVPAKEREVMGTWTADVESAGSNLKMISVLYLDDRQWYPQPRFRYSYGRYTTMLQAGPLPPPLQGADLATERELGNIISEDTLIWTKVGNRWLTELEKVMFDVEQYREIAAEENLDQE